LIKKLKVAGYYEDRNYGGRATQRNNKEVKKRGRRGFILPVFNVFSYLKLRGRAAKEGALVVCVRVFETTQRAWEWDKRASLMLTFFERRL
jgi:hypothetical protein